MKTFTILSPMPYSCAYVYKQLAKSASQRWKSMSDSDKGPFTRIAEAEKAKYNMLRAQMQEDEESE